MLKERMSLHVVAQAVNKGMLIPIFSIRCIPETKRMTIITVWWVALDTNHAFNAKDCCLWPAFPPSFITMQGNRKQCVQRFSQRKSCMCRVVLSKPLPPCEQWLLSFVFIRSPKQKYWVVFQKVAQQMFRMQVVNLQNGAIITSVVEYTQGHLPRNSCSLDKPIGIPSNIKPATSWPASLTNVVARRCLQPMAHLSRDLSMLAWTWFFAGEKCGEMPPSIKLNQKFFKL